MPLSIGTVYAQVKPDTSAMTSKSGMGSAMKTAGLVAAGAFAVSFVKGALEEAKEAEKVGLAFTDSFSRGTENFDSAKIAGMFDKINNEMGISDEELQKWSTHLNNAIDFEKFGKDGEKVLTDMTALIPNLAAQSGKSTSMVEKAIKTLGTAPESGLSALRKLGGLTDGQLKHAEKLVAEGKVQEAQQYAIEKATEASSGAAAKQTTASEKMSIMWAELQETVGMKLLPVLNQLMEWGMKFITFLTSGSTQSKIFMGVIAAMAAGMLVLKVNALITSAAMAVAAAGGLKAWLMQTKIATAMQWLWNAAMSANPIGLIVLAVVALIALVVVLWKKNETFRKIVIAAWNAVKRAVLVVWNAIKAAAMVVFNALKAYVTTMWKVYVAIFNGIKKVVLTVFGWVKSYIKNTWDTIKAVFNAGKEVFSKVFDPLQDAARTVFNAIAGLWNDTVGRLSFSVPDWVPKIGGNSWEVPDIPVLHNGGVFNSGQGEGLALLRDGETVLPTGNGMAGVSLRIVDSNLGLVMDAVVQEEKSYGASRGRMNR